MKHLVGELKKKLFLNHEAQSQNIMNSFDQNLNSVMQQLSFEFSSLFEIKQDNSYMYTMEVLQKDDKDYQFIMRRITNKNSDNNPKVFHMFKIHPVNHIEVSQKCNNELALFGLTADKINDVLKSSFEFDEQCDSRDEWATNDFEYQYSKGISYCNVEKQIRKLSFVFVSSFAPEARVDHLVDQYVYKGEYDSNGNFVTTGNFRNITYFDD